MIISMKPLPLAEVFSRIEKLEGKKPLQDYLKEYCKIPAEKANELVAEIQGLNNLKIKEEHAVKVADFLPRNSEEVHKVFNDVSLDESEVNAIIDVVKKY